MKCNYEQRKKSFGKIGNLKTPQCEKTYKTKQESGSHKICQDSPDVILDVLFNFEKHDSKKVNIYYFHNLKSFTSIFVFLLKFAAVKISLPLFDLLTIF